MDKTPLISETPENVISVESQINECKENIQTTIKLLFRVDQISEEIKENVASDFSMQEYYLCHKQLKILMADIEGQLEDLRNNPEAVSTIDRQRKMKEDYEDCKKSYGNLRKEYDIFYKNKGIRKRFLNPNIDPTQQSVLGSVLEIAEMNSLLNQNSMPIAQVYDQEQLVMKRQFKVKVIKSEAKEINNIAGLINNKVDEGGYKIEDLNKQMKRNRIMTNGINEQLKKTKKSNKIRNRNMMYCCSFVLFLVGVLLITLALMARLFGVDLKKSK